jgi:hypothetical protein
MKGGARTARGRDLRYGRPPGMVVQGTRVDLLPAADHKVEPPKPPKPDPEPTHFTITVAPDPPEYARVRHLATFRP